MNIKHPRILALVGVALAILPVTGAFAAPATGLQGPLPNANLGARHPATLCGRGLHVQTQYVDLHAPLTDSEASRVAGYRGENGQKLPATFPAQ
ncbi:MAG: hypothetical protein P1V35_03065 [Planctomycetota bacterium]|nr:hypothetical protein [Planctomycetota bacterium]